MAHRFWLVCICISLWGCARGESERSVVVFRCSDGQQFAIQYLDRAVLLMTAEHRIKMAARPSGIGQRYVAPEGTLIIDGDFAALVLKNDLTYRDCNDTPRRLRPGCTPSD